MKSIYAALLGLVATTSMFASADLKPVEEKSTAGEVAIQASEIRSVRDFKIGKYAYKVVYMDSRLNGDISTTTMLIVGEGGVGGEAGFEAAFQITPTENAEIIGMRSLRIVRGKLVFTLIGGDMKDVRKVYKYDPKTKTLKELGGK